MGTIKIGSFENKVGITINPRYVLFNGNDVSYIKNELTEIWNNIRTLVPYLTTYKGSDGGEAFASSELSGGYQAWRAFTNSNTNFWHNNDSNQNNYIGYRFTKPTRVVKLYIRNRYNMEDYEVKIGQLQGSNDGVSWENIGNTFSCPSGMNLATTIEVTNKKYYMQYRINIIQPGVEGVAISQIQFYGNQKLI